jgi:hypothetical protein
MIKYFSIVLQGWIKNSRENTSIISNHPVTVKGVSAPKKSSHVEKHKDRPDHFIESLKMRRKN